MTDKNHETDKDALTSLCLVVKDLAIQNLANATTIHVIATRFGTPIEEFQQIKDMAFQLAEDEFKKMQVVTELNELLDK